MEQFRWRVDAFDGERHTTALFQSKQDALTAGAAIRKTKAAVFLLELAYTNLKGMDIFDVVQVIERERE